DALGVKLKLPTAAGADADLVLHASGNAAGLETALTLAGFEATIVELSWYGSERPSVPLGEAFHSRRLTLRSSQVGTVATAQRSRWTSRRRLELALALLAEPRAAALDALVTGESPFADLPRVLPALADARDAPLCHRIAYS